MNNFKHALFAIALFVAAAPLHASDPGALVPTTGGDVHYHNHVHGSEQPPQTWGQFGVSLAMNPKTWLVGGALGTVGWLGWRRRNRRLAREATAEFRTGVTTRLDGVEGAVTENGRELVGLRAVMGDQHTETIERIEAMRGTLDEQGRDIAAIRAAIDHEQTGLVAIAGDVAALRRDNNTVFERLAVVVADSAAARVAAEAAQAAAEAARGGVAELRDNLPGMLETATANLASAESVEGLRADISTLTAAVATLQATIERGQASASGGDPVLVSAGPVAIGSGGALGLSKFLTGIGGTNLGGYGRGSAFSIRDAGGAGTSGDDETKKDG